MVTNVGKDGTFPAYGWFSTMDSFRFEEIVSGNGTFQEIKKVLNGNRRTHKVQRSRNLAGVIKEKENSMYENQIEVL